jgi:hypothetical protein
MGNIPEKLLGGCEKKMRLAPGMEDKGEGGYYLNVIM